MPFATVTSVVDMICFCEKKSAKNCYMSYVCLWFYYTDCLCLGEQNLATRKRKNANVYIFQRLHFIIHTHSSFDLKKKIACVPHDFVGICFAAWLISILTLWSVTG